MTLPSSSEKSCKLHNYGSTKTNRFNLINRARSLIGTTLDFKLERERPVIIIFLY